MKTTTFLKAMVATGLSFAFLSCNKVENPDTDTNSKVAARIVASIQTKAAGANWADGDAIGITTTGNQQKNGAEYVNIKYTGTANGEFTGNPIYFQHKQDVTFTAYYPFAGTEGTEPGTAGLISTQTIPANQTTAQQPTIDFLFAQTTTTVANPTVLFTGQSSFKHAMSMVTINFVQGRDVMLSDLTSYTIKGLVHDGNFNTKTGEAKANGTAADFKMTLTGATDTQFKAPSVIFFPQQVALGQITLDVELYGQTYTATLTLPEAATALAAGTNYTFNVTVHKTSITVGEATITDWVAAPATDAEALM